MSYIRVLFWGLAIPMKASMVVPGVILEFEFFRSRILLAATSGTGNEVTIFAMVRQRGAAPHLIDGIYHKHCLPDYAIVDPTLTTALGAAYVAGIAAGYWSSMEELRQDWSVDGIWNPGMSERDRENNYRHWERPWSGPLIG